MDSKALFEKHNLLPVSAAPLAIALLNGHWVAMRPEKVDRNSLFLVSHAYVAPHAVFELLICLAPHESPLRAVITACYIERTWRGFGIGAEVSGMSSSDQRRWERYCRDTALQATPGQSASYLASQVLHHPALVTLPSALTPRTIYLLRSRGVVVHEAETTDEVLDQAESGEVAIVVADFNGAQYNGADLCTRLSQGKVPLTSVLMTHGRDPKELEVCLYAGASMIVAKPCNQDILILRLQDMLRDDASTIAQHAEADGLMFDVRRRPARSLRRQLVGWVQTWASSVRNLLRPPVDERLDGQQSAA